MHRRLFIAAPFLSTALPLLAVPAFAHPPQAPQGAEARRMIDEVTGFRARLAKAIADKHLPTLKACYADSFTHTDAAGKIDDKAQRLAAAMAGAPLIETAPTSELGFRVFTGPTVIATGRSPLATAADRKTDDIRWTAVYVTAISGWQLAASQATRLAPPA